MWATQSSSALRSSVPARKIAMPGRWTPVMYSREWQLAQARWSATRPLGVLILRVTGRPLIPTALRSTMNCWLNALPDQVWQSEQWHA